MIPVSDLYTACETMLRDAWGYIWGTAGIEWTQARQDAATDEMARKYGARWIGHMVADCSGVFVYIWKRHGLSIAHGSNSIARKSCGPMGKEPRPGYAAFKWRAKDTDKYPDGKGDFYHIGLVAQDGKTVYEARGTKEGFTTSAVSAWQWFAPLKDVSYEDGGQAMTPYNAVVSTASGSLNMRSGPGLSYPITFKLPKGTPVTVLIEYASGWAFIDEDGTQGYVALKYLTRVNGPESAQDAPDAPDGEITAPAVCTRLRRADGVEIALAGLWEVVTKPPDEGE